MHCFDWGLRLCCDYGISICNEVRVVIFVSFVLLKKVSESLRCLGVETILSML